MVIINGIDGSTQTPLDRGLQRVTFALQWVFSTHCRATWGHAVNEKLADWSGPFVPCLGRL